MPVRPFFACPNNDVRPPGKFSVDGVPSLTLKTLPVWYRTCIEHCAAQIEQWGRDCAAAAKAKAARDEEEDSDHEGEGSDGRLIARGSELYASLFHLSTVTKAHPRSAPILGAFAKSGGRAVETFLKADAFVESELEFNAEDVLRLVGIVQKSTRAMQAICSDGKTSRELSIGAKARAELTRPPFRVARTGRCCHRYRQRLCIKSRSQQQR